MSEWEKIVENILQENNINLRDIETIDSKSYLKYYQELNQEIENKYIKEKLKETRNEFNTFLENITAKDIRKKLEETDNTPKREHDIAWIKTLSNTVDGYLQHFVSNNVYFNQPRKDGIIYFKTIPQFPDIYLMPKTDKGIASYNFKDDIIEIYVLNQDGTYNPVEFAKDLSEKSIFNALIHEFTHKLQKNDKYAKGKPFKATDNTHSKEYSNNENEIDAFTNQIIVYIEDNLKDLASDIRLNRSKGLKQYSWKQAISDAINLLLSDLYKQPIGETLKRMDDNNLKKMYRTIYEYFYARYFKQYIIDNPDQYNQELKSINKDN